MASERWMHDSIPWSSTMSDQLVTRRAHLAFGVLEMFAALGFFILIYGVLNIFVGELFSGLGLAAQSSELSRTQSYIESVWTLLPFVALLIVALRLLSRAAFESRGGV
jgi:hypothetical protein